MDNQETEDYIFNQGMEKGKAEGLQRGAATRNLEIAKGMLKKGWDINLIQELTGLSLDIIHGLLGR